MTRRRKNGGNQILVKSKRGENNGKKRQNRVYKKERLSVGCTKLGEWNNAAGDGIVKWQGESYSCGDVSNEGGLWRRREKEGVERRVVE